MLSTISAFFYTVISLHRSWLETAISRGERNFEGSRGLVPFQPSDDVTQEWLRPKSWKRAGNMRRDWKAGARHKRALTDGDGRRVIRNPPGLIKRRRGHDTPPLSLPGRAWKSEIPPLSSHVKYSHFITSLATLATALKLHSGSEASFIQGRKGQIFWRILFRSSVTLWTSCLSASSIINL